MKKITVREFLRNFVKMRNQDLQVYKNAQQVGTWTPITQDDEQPKQNQFTL